MDEMSGKKGNMVLTVLAVGHAFLIYINGFFHQEVNLLYRMGDFRVLLLFMMALPMAAAALLLSKGGLSASPKRRFGLILLSGLTPALFLYNVYDRFFSSLPVTAFLVSSKSIVLFECSYWLVLLVEAAMFVFAVWQFKEFHGSGGTENSRA
jgi:hypothetical protein